MRHFALTAERVFDGSKLGGRGGVVIDQGRIESVFWGPDAPIGVRAERVPGLLAPGFVDLQVNGGGGALWDHDPGLEALETIARAHRNEGTTSFLATTISPAPERLRSALDSISNAVEELESNSLRVLGIHVEGPYLNRARTGAHPPSAIRSLPTREIEWLCASRRGTTLLTLAPERVPRESIRALCDRGVRVFAGHSEATAEEFRAARGAGLCGVTHLFNAMPAPANRAPGVAGACLADAEAMAGIIADGAHVDWTTFGAALAALGPDRLFFVSDAMPPAGVASPEPFSLGAGRIRVRGDGDERHCVMEDGTLAGSCLSIAAALRNAVGKADVPLEDALRMASATPARAIGREREVGSLVPGGWADLISLSDALVPQSVWMAGERVVGS